MNKTYQIAIAAALIMILLATAGASAQTFIDYDEDGFDDRDGSDPDPYDSRVPDRDGDGIRDTEDRYPDDPYNRDTTDYTDRPEEDTTDGDTSGDDSDDGALGGGDVCCMFGVPWFWIIVGSLTLAWGYVENSHGKVNRFYVCIIAGLAMIVYGFSLWGVF